MRHAFVLTALIVLLVPLAGCGGGSPETRELVLVTSEDPALLAGIAESFTARSGRALDLRAFDAERDLPKRFDLLLLPADAPPMASASAETLAALHAWPLARAGAGAHHDEGLWVGVARSDEALLAAAVSASSDIEADARELVAFLLSDEGQAALDSIEGLEALVTPAP